MWIGRNRLRKLSFANVQILIVLSNKFTEHKLNIRMKELPLGHCIVSHIALEGPVIEMD